MMRPDERIPSDVLARQWEYLAAAAGPWSRLWRRIVAAWRCARLASAHQRRQIAWMPPPAALATPWRTDMTDYTIPRTGNRPLAFTGEELATSSSQGSEGPAQNRWHELALYRTQAGALIVAISYRTRWQGEIERHDAIEITTSEAAVDELRGYDPCSHLLGYPPGEHYDDKRARQREELRQRYEAAVSVVLAALEPERIE